VSDPSPSAIREPLTPAVLRWAGVGSVFQVGVVVAGHFNDAIYGVWPAPLLSISLLAASAYVIQVRRSSGDSAWHGGMVSGICAFLGVALAAVLADAPTRDLAALTIASIASGALTGWLTFAGLDFVSPARVE